MIPVQELNSAQDFSSESDSGLRIEANIVTVVPECPAYGWYLAHAADKGGAELALLPPPLELLEQAAARERPSSAGATRSRFRSRELIVMFKVFSCGLGRTT
ncbi:hypothetical protein OG455_13300 [Kitasatospora sp. NBC_01287]|uniref:hypothetical protein n=1 Tax=Kitasatospora sp. NBC_01287 TaxID=2903573 RepID=UPI0022588783|nr:hypothetical protein [Kitasatospora sp. NBC_01287]MCX4746489.1 hypothetical protein [Kitasatospora sp. NBC_01287]